MEGSSFVQLLDESRIGVLARIYAILCRIPLKGPRYIKDLMATHVKEVGKARPFFAAPVSSLFGCSAAVPFSRRLRRGAALCVQALVTDSETGKDPVAFTQKVLDLRAKYMRVISEAFAGDRQFPQALHLAFEVRRATPSALRCALSLWPPRSVACSCVPYARGVRTR